MNFHVGQKVYFKKNVMELWERKHYGISAETMDRIIKEFTCGGTIEVLDDTIMIENCGFFFLKEWFEIRPNFTETEE